MKFIKRYLKFIIGVCVLLLCGVIFYNVMSRSSNLNTKTLKDWRSASVAQRVDAIKMIAASDDNIDDLVKCVDKFSELPQSGDYEIVNAVRLCKVGYQLKENL